MAFKLNILNVTEVMFDECEMIEESNGTDKLTNLNTNVFEH